MFARDCALTKAVRKVLWSRYRKPIPDAEIAEKAIRSIGRQFINPIRAATEAGTATVTRETWDHERIAALWSPITEGKPYSTDGEMIVMRINGTDILIDGHNRRAKRIAEADTSPHDVLVIEIPRQASQ